MTRTEEGKNHKYLQLILFHPGTNHHKLLDKAQDVRPENCLMILVTLIMHGHHFCFGMEDMLEVKTICYRLDNIFNFCAKLFHILINTKHCHVPINSCDEN